MFLVIDDFLRNGKVTLISKTPYKGHQWFYGHKAYLRGDDVSCNSYEFRLYDPLLSRLPAVQEDNWVIGHMYRKIPSGYRLTLETGINYIEDKNLWFYYDKLKFILSGNLFDLERLKELIKFNSGNYDKYLQEYIKNNDLSTEDGLRSCYIC